MDDLWIVLLSLLIFIIGIVSIILVFKFGQKIYDVRHYNMIDHWHHLLRKRPSNFSEISNISSEILERRNEFWTTIGQVFVAILIIVTLSILLITKSISAEAGLPILSAVSGFAIAKGVPGRKSFSSSDKTEE